jgi:hypothetical protein
MGASIVATKVILLSEFKNRTEEHLRRCHDSGQTLVVELADRCRVAIEPWDESDHLIDDLIATNAAFRQVLAESAASPRQPLPLTPTKKRRKARAKKK